MSPASIAAATCLLGLAVLIAGGVRLRRELRARSPYEGPISEESDVDEVIVMTLRVPHLASGDAEPIGPCELLAASHLLAHQIQRLANAMHVAAMESMLAQVVADEAAAGLDAALQRITDGVA